MVGFKIDITFEKEAAADATEESTLSSTSIFFSFFSIKLNRI
jgi:hypothetical protein